MYYHQGETPQVLWLCQYTICSLLDMLVSHMLLIHMQLNQKPKALDTT